MPSVRRICRRAPHDHRPRREVCRERGNAVRKSHHGAGSGRRHARLGRVEAGGDEREAHFERCAVTAAGACARSMRPNAARQVLEVAKKRAAREAGAWPKTVLYNAVLDAFEAAGRSTDALQLLDEYDRNGVPYDAVTYNIVLRLCARDGAYQRAAELLDEMVADPSPKVRPDVFSFTTAIKACCVEPKRRRRDDRRRRRGARLPHCSGSPLVGWTTSSLLGERPP